MAEFTVAPDTTFQISVDAGACGYWTVAEPIVMHAGELIYVNGAQFVQQYDSTITFVNNTACTSNQPIGYSGATGITVGTNIQIFAGTGTGNSAGVYTFGNCGTAYIVQPPMTPEQQAEFERQHAQQRARYAREQRLREKAEIRAEKLLQQLVGKRMYEVYKQRGYFEMICESGKRYRFRKQQRVQIMDGLSGNKVAYELCIIHLDYTVPPTDTLVTLLLLAMSGEDGERIMHEKGNRRAA